MKTLTEFSAFALREAHLKTKEIHAALQTEGKPADELEAAQKEALNAFLTEKHKLEGEKLELFLKALEVAAARPRDLENLRRVVVYSLSEGEKVSEKVVVRDTHAFGAEYLASLRPAKADRRESGSKFSKEKGKGRGKRRDDMKGRRPDGSPERRGANERKPRPEGRPGFGAPGASMEGLAPGHIPVAPARGPRPPRGERRPRSEGAGRAAGGERRPRGEGAVGAAGGERKPRTPNPAKMPSTERLPLIQPKQAINPAVAQAAAAARAAAPASETPAN